MHSTIRIVIIAPAPALRAGLRALVDAAGLEVIDEAAAPSQALLDTAQVDVVLLGEAGLLSELRYMLSNDAQLAVLLLSDDQQAAFELRSMALRGWGLLPNESEPDELQNAIRAIAHNLVVIAKPYANQLIGSRPIPTMLESTPETLTTRELEVLGLLSQGLANKQIAKRLLISDHTVKFHISAIFAKLGASSRTDAVSRAARQGLITL